MRINKSLLIEVILILLILFVITGCVLNCGTTKIYNVTTSKQDLSILIKILKIKYICERTYGAFNMDFYKSNCYFAMYIIKDGKKTMKLINSEEAEKLGLKVENYEEHNPLITNNKFIKLFYD